MPDPFDLATLHIDPTDGELVRLAKVPAKVRKRRQGFIQVPWLWFEKLANETGRTYRVALYLLHLDWKGGGKPFKLSNKSLEADGVSRQSKGRALTRLEALGLIRIERRAKRSPIIHLSHPRDMLLYHP
jgi:hypothetical protein